MRVISIADLHAAGACTKWAARFEKVFGDVEVPLATVCLKTVPLKLSERLLVLTYLIEAFFDTMHVEQALAMVASTPRCRKLSLSEHKYLYTWLLSHDRNERLAAILASLPRQTLAGILHSVLD